MVRALRARPIIKAGYKPGTHSEMTEDIDMLYVLRENFKISANEYLLLSGNFDPRRGCLVATVLEARNAQATPGETHEFAAHHFREHIVELKGLI